MAVKKKRTAKKKLVGARARRPSTQQKKPTSAGESTCSACKGRGPCTVCGLMNGKEPRRTLFDDSFDLKITRKYSEVTRGVGLERGTFFTHSPLRVESGMTFVEIVDALGPGRGASSLTGRTPNQPSRWSRLRFLFDCALWELEQISKEAEAFARPTVASATILTAAVQASLMRVETVGDAIEDANRLGEFGADLLEKLEQQPGHHEDVKLAKEVLDQNEAMKAKLARYRPNLLAKAAVAARRAFASIDDIDDWAGIFHHALWQARTRADWARSTRDLVEFRLTHWMKNNSDPDFLQGAAPDPLEEVGEWLVRTILEELSLMADEMELLELSDVVSLPDRQTKALRSVRSYLAMCRLNDKTPDVEHIITKTLLGLGYEERSARSLWDADKKQVDRKSKRPASDTPR